MHLSSYHAAPVDPLRVAQAEARAAQAACRRAEQQLDEMKDAYRQAGDREHVLITQLASTRRHLERSEAIRALTEAEYISVREDAAKYRSLCDG